MTENETARIVGAVPERNRPWWKSVDYAMPQARVFPDQPETYHDLRDKTVARSLAVVLTERERRGERLHPVEQLVLNVYREGRHRGFADGWNIVTRPSGKSLLRRLDLAVRFVFKVKPKPRRPK